MRFWTSDLHIAHRNIINLCKRPFADLDHMHTELARRWNSVVTPDDEVWIIGDGFMGGVENSICWLGRVAGHVILVPGNHDKCFPTRRDWQSWRRFYEHEGIEIKDHDPGHWVETEIEGIEVAVCHFPTLHSDIDKYADWRPQTSGWVIHGHTHSPQRIIGRNVHVGTDAWDFTPITDHDIAELMGLS